MFLRYFYLVFGGCSYKSSGTEAGGLFQRQKVEEREAGGGRLSKAPDGCELVTRDVGVACLALSVKVGIVILFVHRSDFASSIVSP
jgi:hypothetical protein